MRKLPKELNELIELFNSFPGVGPKTAERFAIFLTKQNKDFIKKIINSILNIRKNIHFCEKCFNLTYKIQGNICSICKDNKRDKTLICIVEDIPDLLAIESTGKYKGTYYILGNLINPILKKSISKFRIEKLLNRIKIDSVKEIILALNTDTEGEATSLYLKEIILKKFPGLKITRIGKGLPQGSDLEYADEITLGFALKNRFQF